MFLNFALEQLRDVQNPRVTTHSLSHSYNTAQKSSRQPIERFIEFRWKSTWICISKSKFQLQNVVLSCSLGGGTDLFCALDFVPIACNDINMGQYECVIEKSHGIAKLQVQK
jgi:hypothetical protein